MFKKFLEGLVFGGGFGISFLILWYFAAYVVTPMFFSSQMDRAFPQQAEVLHESGTPFHELKLEEQIKQASVIALAKYEPAPDGKMKAVIKEFLKKEPDATIYYNVSDEYAPSSYYPKKNTNYGDGLIMFFTGSPAMMRMSMSYTGDRIGGLGDLPLELLKQKCKDSGG